MLAIEEITRTLFIEIVGVEAKLLASLVLLNLYNHQRIRLTGYSPLFKINTVDMNNLRILHRHLIPLP